MIYRDNPRCGKSQKLGNLAFILNVKEQQIWKDIRAIKYEYYSKSRQIAKRIFEANALCLIIFHTAAKKLVSRSVNHFSAAVLPAHALVWSLSARSSAFVPLLNTKLDEFSFSLCREFTAVSRWIFLKGKFFFQVLDNGTANHSIIPFNC